jgi:tetratricopeptide (TPR) repeat protein
MNRRILWGVAAWALALAAPLASAAQIVYYNPPKLLKQGKPTSAAAGAGVVVVQVLVNKDGTFAVQHVIRTTNAGDNAAALEIAKTSTYAPASRGPVKLTAFYDFTLKFASGGAASSDADTAASSGADQYFRMITAGNYSAAQSGLRTYVAQHPGDAKGQLDLGIADTFLNAFDDAADAFDKAGTIPENYHALAAKAYSEASVAESKAGDKAAAVAHAKQAVALAPGPFTYNALGLAENQAGDDASAVAAFEKSRSLAQSDPSVKPPARAEIDANLVAVYLELGEPDRAKPVADEAKQLDPSGSSVQNVFANYYYKQGQAAAAAGKQDDAAAAYEQAAAASAQPAQAAQFYASAAAAYLSAKPTPENDKAKADADKALALDPDSAVANFAAGVALANESKTKDALVYLNKADVASKKGSDTNLTAQIESIIKQLSGAK